jgi:nucleoside-diphosphate-sugar epimerase/membrane-associated phospholipid phosphatase
MRVLVTGGTGFIGSHVVEALVEAGHRVRALVRPERPKRWLSGLDVEPVEGNLWGLGLDDAVCGVDAIVHLAGLTRGMEHQLWEANVRGTERLLLACRRKGMQGVRFILGSSQAAAGPSDAQNPRTEADPPRPTTAYGVSKLEAERRVRAESRRLRPLILRFVTVYGPRDRDILPLFRWADRGVGFVAGKDEPRFQLVHAHDAARAVLRALDADDACGATLFVGHPRPVGWVDVLTSLESAIGHPVRRLPIPRACVLALGGVATALRIGHVKPGIIDVRRARDLYAFWLCDVSRIRETLGWTAEMDLMSGIHDTVSGERMAVMSRGGAWTPTDRILLLYSSFSGLLALLWGWRLGTALWLGIAGGHLGVLGLVLWMRRVPVRGFSWAGFARDAYPLVALLFLYWELRHLALLFNDAYRDPTVIAWEQAIFGEQLAVTLRQRLPSTVVSEVLHFGYGSYWLLIPVVGATLYLRRKVEGFREVVFTLLPVFFACYLVFIFWSVEGPYYQFERAGPPYSDGFFRGIVDAVLGPGASRGAAFPSSHVAVAVAALCVSYRWERALFWVLLPLVSALTVGTVYGGFHYGIDAAAGVLVGLLGFAATPRIRRFLALDGAGAVPEGQAGQRFSESAASNR